MSTAAEIKAKIEKIKNNSHIADNFKKQLIAKEQRKLDALEKEEKSAPAPAPEKPKKGKRGPKKSTTSKSKTTATYKGKRLAELDENECAEMQKEVQARRKSQASAEKKSKSRPVIEKIAANVGTAARQAINNIPAEDLKANPKKEIGHMEKIEAATRTYLQQMKAILGDDWDKEAVEDELKDIHKLVTDLKKKYS